MLWFVIQFDISTAIFRDPSSGFTTPRIQARRAQAVTSATNGSASTSLTHKTLTWRPWKRKIIQKNPAAEKMLIPLPIPHPVHIAIAIHNRDSDQPIALDSEICWDILKAIEDCHSDIQVRKPTKTNRIFSTKNLIKKN